MAADYYSRPRLLTVAVSLFSLATVVQGLSWRYWQLVVGRMLLAAGDAACTPLAVSLITELYPANQRGAATALLHQAVYCGFGLSQATHHTLLIVCKRF